MNTLSITQITFFGGQLSDEFGRIYLIIDVAMNKCIDY